MSKEVVVITDSGCDLEPEFAKEHGIDERVPLSITFGPKGEEGTFFDRVTLSSREFFQKVKSSRFFPTTAAPSVDAFEKAYERAMERKSSGNVFSIHLPRPPVSRTIESAEAAAKKLMEKNKKLRFEIVDSGQFTLGLGIPAIVAGELASRGKKLPEIVEEINKILPRLYTFVLLDTLEFAKKGGRVSLVKYLVASVLGYKPIIEMHRGELTTIAKIRTIPKAVEAFTRHLKKLAENYGPFEIMAVEHCDAENIAQKISSDLNENFVRRRDLGVFEAGPTLGSHGGPGAVGVSILLPPKT
ncbi:hypothetical protein A2Z23_01450 [Candidatus Curtissbacteria bacterium RBG_16_39_7]|uniref:DegV family protein n=1 Tax=Candidatus Curtissbacteria bacterium RBG_16_39_7 TaxID=1797707 RepID=A0A1F5G4T7_9BACT|nr:MAG: hypothetical protein A2Z23_01450 [Candidatus Curtissbacteria bacterium RBG_16_39_7]